MSFALASLAAPPAPPPLASLAAAPLPAHVEDLEGGAVLVPGRRLRVVRDEVLVRGDALRPDAAQQHVAELGDVAVGDDPVELVEERVVPCKRRG
jgi:hypothetical protein